MSAEKLDRLKDPVWDPPVLSFVIERHGETVLGSSRASLQHWSLNLETGKATCNPNYSYRQLRPRDSPLKIEPLVEEVAGVITHGKEDDRLVWSGDRSTVRVLVSRFISGHSKQTRQGRRKSFRDALDEKLCAKGWTKVPHGRDRYGRR